jgi:hypothetical protein
MSHTGEEYENPVSGERSVVRLGADDTDGLLTLADLYLRPGGGPNEHLHSYLHETFEVLGGRVGFRLNGREEITGPSWRLPPGWSTTSGTPATRRRTSWSRSRPGAGSSR